MPKLLCLRNAQDITCVKTKPPLLKDTHLTIQATTVRVKLQLCSVLGPATHQITSLPHSSRSAVTLNDYVPECISSLVCIQ